MNRAFRCFLLTALIAVLAALPVLTVCAAGTESGNGEKDPGKGTLTVTVVEDIPAEEIEENEVPLAALPETPARRGVRHVLLAALLLASAAGYVVYFRRYDRRLALLRRRAAEAELAAMRARARNREAVNPAPENKETCT